MKVFGKEFNSKDNKKTPQKFLNIEFETKASYLQNSYKETHLQNLKSHDIDYGLQLNKNQKRMRQKLLKWGLSACKETLQLTYITVQHCLRLFDVYVSKKGRFFKNLTDGQLHLLSCLFISSKYLEIYPPCISDFTYLSGQIFTISDILSTQISIVKEIDFNLHLSLVSDWYGTLYGTCLPEWGYQCYVLSQDIIKKYLSYSQVDLSNIK